jgi:serpin B
MRAPTRLSLVATAAAIALTATGCAGGSGTGSTGPRPRSLPAGHTAPLTKVRLSADQLAALAVADDRFAGDLVRALANDDSGNLVVSPASVAIALQMLADGSGGSTRSQLERALHADGMSIEELTAGGAAMFRRLKGLTAQVAIADDVWVQRGEPVSRRYAADVERGFGAGLHSVDLGDPTSAAQAINRSVADTTRGHITGIVTPQELQQAIAVLTDAIYLKADWATPFDASATHPAPFATAGGGSERVPTMHRTATLDYVAGSGYQAVTLPYAGGRLAMSVFLPARGSSPADVEAAAARHGWSALLPGSSPTSVALSLPRFELRTSTDLTPVLRSLGITAAFGPTADLSGICRQCDVSAVEHQAWIRTDEKGTTAAAATGVVVGTTAIRAGDPTAVVMTVDRPFLAVVRDRATGLPLFVAQVARP